uniref:Uncharacterized protein n=1 Tax=Borely moumouvirus TaxID=2712067 RepID=A0A6G6AC18_9VIRU
MSEFIAQIAVTDNFKSKYVPKSRRNDIINYEDDLRKFLENYSENEESLFNDMEYKSNKIDLDYYQKIYALELYDPENKSEIVSMNLEIGLENYNENFGENSNKIAFSIEIGGSIIFHTNLENIIMLSKYLGMDTIYENDKIIIPIPLKQLFFCKNFPFYKLKYSSMCIKIYNDNGYINRLGFGYQTKTLTNPNKLSFLPKRIVVFQVQQDEYKPLIRLNFNGLCKVIMFNIEYDREKLIDPQINQIKLYLNNHRPIVYDLDDGEILEYHIFGKKYYAISLCKQLVYKKDIKKIFKDEEDILTGINFSRLDDVDIEIICDDADIYGSIIKFATISVNELNFMEGMAGLKYTY